MASLEMILERVRQHCLHLNINKYVFAQPSIECIDHEIHKQAIHKSERYIKEIRNAPRPSTIEELQLFLGKATYYGTFIPELSTKNRPLIDVLEADKFGCIKESEKVYNEIKEILVPPQVLIPYDPALSLILANRC